MLQGSFGDTRSSDLLSVVLLRLDIRVGVLRVPTRVGKFGGKFEGICYFCGEWGHHISECKVLDAEVEAKGGQKGLGGKEILGKGNMEIILELINGRVISAIPSE